MHKGGWTRVMMRIDNSTTAFNKSWQEYSHGFGDYDGNYWLGLETLRKLTNQQQMSVRIELSNSEYDSYMIEYDKFFIGPAEQKYKLTLGKMTLGSLVDSFQRQNAMRFSTYDQDNDNDNLF